MMYEREAQDVYSDEQLTEGWSDLYSIDVYCKDCIKHNKGLGDYKVSESGEVRFLCKDEACPLVDFRGKAQGHEFDYQFCCYGRRREKDD